MEKLKLCGTGERRFGKALLVWQEDGSLRVYLDYRGAYGLGERFDALNQKGRRVVCEVEEKFCFQGNKSYCPAPFFWTDSGFGLYAGTCETTVFDFREGEILAQLPEGCEVTLFSGTPEGLIQSAAGHVGTFLEKDAAQERGLHITARVNTSRGVRCRAVADKLPAYVQAEEPSLEDAYLYLISREAA